MSIINITAIIQFIAGWSSLAARVAHNHEVAGSNPAPATFEWERGRENGSCSGVEVLKPQGFKEHRVRSENPAPATKAKKRKAKS